MKQYSNFNKMKIYNSFEEIFDSIPVDEFKQLPTKEKNRYIGKTSSELYRKDPKNIKFPKYAYSGDTTKETEDIDRMEFSNIVKERYNRFVRDAIAHGEEIDHYGTLTAAIADVAENLYGINFYWDNGTWPGEMATGSFNPDGTLKSFLIQLDKLNPDMSVLPKDARQA